MAGRIPSDLVEHVKLIRAFVNGEITADDFERHYLRVFKNDPVIHEESAFDVIETLFFHVDEYFVDPAAGPEDTRREQEKLRSHAKAALERLT